MPIVRKFLTPDEFSNASLRYNPDCDCVQYTPDGGTTWYDQPAADPRTSPTSRLPALTGDDRACRAAAGMTKLIEQSVNKRIDAVTAIEFAGAILGIVAFIPGFNVLYALVLALAAFAFTIAREVLEAAFTEEVYDQIRCILVCNVDEDGQMSAAQLASAYAQLDDLDEVPKLWAQQILATVGEVGMSDAGVALAEAADCDECDCGWSLCWNLETLDEPAGFGTIYGTYGSPQPGLNGQDNGANNRSAYYIEAVGSVYTTVVKMAMTYAMTDAGGVNRIVSVELYNDALSMSEVLTQAPIADSQLHTLAWEGSFTANHFVCQGNTGASNGSQAVMTYLYMEGFGDPPEVLASCE